MQYAVYQAEWRRPALRPDLGRRHDHPRGGLPRRTRLFEWLFNTTRWYTNSYGSLFYIMSGLHGLHVFIGLVAMSSSSVGCAATSAATPASCRPSRASRYYWHFVDIVWVGLYSCLFLLK